MTIHINLKCNRCPVTCARGICLSNKNITVNPAFVSVSIPYFTNNKRSFRNATRNSRKFDNKLWI